MNKLKAIKGTSDVLPGDVEIWQRIEQVVRETMALYAYNEIRTPMFEETNLFARSIGEDTDVVGKEMYTFKDMGGRSLTLRPEGTASVVRAFIEHSLDQKGLPRKLWYMGPMFRQERPQKGRQRQFHQFGVELIGSFSPMADTEVIILFDRITAQLGLECRLFSLNSIGGEKSRKAYREALVAFLGEVEEELCVDCKRRMTTNPLRVLDCKVPGCRKIFRDSGKLPKTLDYLIDEDCFHFESVQGYLNNLGIAYEVDNFLVRGFDYYTGTVFEMNCKGLGAQSEVMGGGRYDDLLGELGGSDLPAVGFACGMERLVMVLQEAEQTGLSGKDVDIRQSVQVYIIKTDDRVCVRAVNYLEMLRRFGYSADMDYMDRSVKAQMKAASKQGARFTLIIEPEPDMVTARDMEKSRQESMTFEKFLKVLKENLSHGE
ncbi:histidine--tRNA ligase [Candidatus Latescibacterota bacterium]